MRFEKDKASCFQSMQTFAAGVHDCFCAVLFPNWTLRWLLFRFIRFCGEIHKRP